MNPRTTLSIPQYLLLANIYTLRHYALSSSLVLSSSQDLPLDLSSIPENVLFIFCIGCGRILLIAHLTEFAFIFEGIRERKINIRGCEGALRFKRENIREKVDKSVAAGERNAQACPKEKYKS